MPPSRQAQKTVLLPTHATTVSAPTAFEHTCITYQHAHCLKLCLELHPITVRRRDPRAILPARLSVASRTSTPNSMHVHASTRSNTAATQVWINSKPEGSSASQKRHVAFRRCLGRVHHAISNVHSGGCRPFMRRLASSAASCTRSQRVLIQTFVSSALVAADDFAGAGDAELLPLLLSSSALAPDARMARDGRGFSAAGSSFAAAGAVGAAGGAGFSFVFLSSSLSSSLALSSFFYA